MGPTPSREAETSLPASLRTMTVSCGVRPAWRGSLPEPMAPEQEFDEGVGLALLLAALVSPGGDADE